MQVQNNSKATATEPTTPVELTAKEFTVVSDILRRIEPGGLFSSRREFATALDKIEEAKWASYEPWRRWLEDHPEESPAYETYQAFKKQGHPDAQGTFDEWGAKTWGDLWKR